MKQALKLLKMGLPEVFCDFTFPDTKSFMSEEMK
jgi:hypothetical protein